MQEPGFFSLFFERRAFLLTHLVVKSYGNVSRKTRVVDNAQQLGDLRLARQRMENWALVIKC